MLAETAENFCKSEFPLPRTRKNIDEGTNFDDELWGKIVEMGWLSVAIDEAHGGLGLPIGSVVAIAEAMGKSLTVSPFIPCSVGIGVLNVFGTEQQKTQWFSKIQEGQFVTLASSEGSGEWDFSRCDAQGDLADGELHLSGTKVFVEDADKSSLILVSAMIQGSPRLVLIPTASINPAAIRRHTSVDLTKRCFSVDLDGIKVSSENVIPGNPFPWLDNYLSLLVSAEICGGMSSCLHLIVEYLNTRKAFGSFIGSFQSLKHPAAAILLKLEEQKSLVYHAASLFGDGDANAIEVAVRMAKANGSESFVYAGDRAVQFHGGMGFTWECDAQLYLKRALWCQLINGDEQYQRQKLGSLWFD